MHEKTAHKKHPLSIRLTESAVFLRSDGTGRRHRGQEGRPALLRGLLTLELYKPMRISSIELDLKAKSSTTWPEGIGARRAEITEEHEVYRASTTFFRANGEHQRRNSSLGPGAAYFTGEYDSDELLASPQSPRGESSRQQEPRELVATSGPLTGRSRRLSADSSYFFRDHPGAEPTLFPPTPPYSPPVISPASSSSELDAPTSAPAYTLEEHRNNLHAELRDRRNQVHTPPLSNSSVSSRSNRRADAPLSRQPSIEDIPENSQLARNPENEAYSQEPGTPRNHSRTPSQTPSRIPSPHQATPSTSHEEPRRPSSRSRFSLASVSNVLMDVVRHHSHDSHGHHEEEEGRGRTKEKRHVTHSPISSVPRSRERSTLSRIGDILKLEHDEAHLGQGWKEFKAGTYTYPISFEIPANSPPTLRCDYGSVSWCLRAVAHRPGTFTSKLAVHREVIVIAAPTEDDTENSENIIVERMWEDQLQYLISVAGRSFYIGGTIPITFGLLPLAKAKVHRLTVHLEERVDYCTNMKRIARSDPPSRIDLLSFKSENGEHILPLESDDVEAFHKSPLHALADENADPSEIASSLMGPGPWSFHKELQLSASCNFLHITNKNKRSNIIITHHLKCVIRIESANPVHVDPKTGKKKLFDIVIQMPVQILSCRCNPAWSSLPPYSEVLDDHCVVVPVCPCEIRRQNNARPAALERMVSRLSFDSAISPVETRSVNPLTMPSLQSRNELYERLVSGQESETGEAPPEYYTVTARPVHH